MTEKEINKLNNGRMLRSESQYLLPMIIKRKDNAVGLLVSYFKEGRTDMILAVTAQISAYYDLESEITKNNKETESLERKSLNGT